MNIVVNGLLTNYHRTGSGKTIVLLHGWGDSLETFSDLQARLTSEYDVITLDLPGFGKTQAPEEVWGLTNYAHFVAEALKKLGVKDVYAYVAHSNGASVAIRGLGQGILSAEKVVLLGAAGIRNRQLGKRLVLKIVAKTGKVATFWLPISTRKKLQKALYGAVGSDMLVAPHLQETFKRTVREDVQADAQKIAIPTLLIYGEKDRATPVLYGQIYHEIIDGSRLETIGSAGHFVHQDNPVEVAKMLKEFLNA